VPVDKDHEVLTRPLVCSRWPAKASFPRSWPVVCQEIQSPIRDTSHCVGSRRGKSLSYGSVQQAHMRSQWIRQGMCKYCILVCLDGFHPISESFVVSNGVSLKWNMRSDVQVKSSQKSVFRVCSAAIIWDYKPAYMRDSQPKVKRTLCRQG
jgi:hypothetical protein